MLQPGDPIPHFEVTALHGDAIRYSTIWQRRNLVLITLPAAASESSANAIAELAARVPELSAHDTACVVTRDTVPGMPVPGLLVADRWGEVVHVANHSSAADLPGLDEVLVWVEHVRNRCPECEGEAR